MGMHIRSIGLIVTLVIGAGCLLSCSGCSDTYATVIEVKSVKQDVVERAERSFGVGYTYKDVKYSIETEDGTKIVYTVPMASAENHLLNNLQPNHTYLIHFYAGAKGGAAERQCHALIKTVEKIN